MSRYTLLHTKQTRNKVLLWGTGNYTLRLAIAENGKECVRITEPLSCAPEVNPTL